MTVGGPPQLGLSAALRRAVMEDEGYISLLGAALRSRTRSHETSCRRWTTTTQLKAGCGTQRQVTTTDMSSKGVRVSMAMLS